MSGLEIFGLICIAFIGISAGCSLVKEAFGQSSFGPYVDFPRACFGFCIIVATIIFVGKNILDKLGY